MKDKITYPDLFIKTCDDYFYNGRLRQPESKDKRVFTISASEDDYPSQKPVKSRNRNFSTEFGGSLISLIELVDKIHKNLNYRKGSGQMWKSFYTFPSKNTISKYKREVCKVGEEESSIFAVNENEQSVDAYAKSIIDTFENDECSISFLNGTTGVGKTTFLKYFTKTRKPYLLQSKVIISRIKYRFIENIYDSKPDNNDILQDIVAENIIDCLFRDIIDSCYLSYANPNLFEDETNDLLKVLRESIVHEIKSESNEIITFDETEFSKHADLYLRDIPKKIKKQAIIDADGMGFKFCIILDGFDAMRPEEIRLLGEKKEVDFLKCLSSIIRNALASGSVNGELIYQINKTFIVAARPITIMQLKAPIQPDTDWDHKIANEVFVIGSDIFKLLENRIKVRFTIEGKPIPELALFEAIENGLNTIIGEIYRNHPSVERGRFIDLFNHNIRQKLVFLSQCIDYFIRKVEFAYSQERGSPLNPSGARLDTAMFLKYSKYTAADLRINLYEVQKLLILPRAGKFKNHFKYDALKNLLPEEDTGPFDNIFNYLRYEGLLNYEEAKEQGWPAKYDRILIKVLCLHYIVNNNGKTLYKSMIDWILEKFPKLSFDSLDAKVLMRSGLIRMDIIQGDQWIEISRKGKFILQELLLSSIYIEHALLNSRVPYYMNIAIKPPVKKDRRHWALYSIVNSVVFLKYLLHVAEHIETKTSLIKDFVCEIYEAIKPSFKGVIIEGSNELGKDFQDECMRRILTLNESIVR